MFRSVHTSDQQRPFTFRTDKFTRRQDSRLSRAPQHLCRGMLKLLHAPRSPDRFNAESSQLLRNHSNTKAAITVPKPPTERVRIFAPPLARVNPRPKSSACPPTKHPHHQVFSPTDSDKLAIGACLVSAARVLSVFYRSSLVRLRSQRAESPNLSPHPWKQRTQYQSPRNRIQTAQGISPDTSHRALRYCVLQSVCTVSPDSCPPTCSGNMSMSVGSSVLRRGTAPPRIA